MKVTPSKAVGSEQQVRADVTLWIYTTLGWRQQKTKYVTAVLMNPMVYFIGVDNGTRLPTVSFDVEVTKGWTYAITTELTWGAQIYANGGWPTIGTKTVSYAEAPDYLTFGGATTGRGGYCTMII